MRDENLYLINILEYVRHIKTFTSAGRSSFLTDRKTQEAVIRCFEVIGEATKRLSETTRDSYPEIPWRRMAGMRDVLIHQYEGVDLEEVWEVIEHMLPSLERDIVRILGQREIPL